MKKKYLSLALIILVTVAGYAQDSISEQGGEFSNDLMSPLAVCFTDKKSEYLCWQESKSELDPAVLYDFGVHYINGDGTTQDFSKGRYWIHKAALNGYPLAQYNLGVMFFDGIGGVQSRECAAYWLNKAALDTADVREMANQALAAMNSQPLNGFPKVYRVLTSNECELVPDVEAPADEIETSIDKGDISVSDEAKLKAEVEISPVDIPKNVDVEEEATDKVIPGYFREKIGQYFIRLGNNLLRQDDSQSSPYMSHHSPDIYCPAEPVDKTQADEIMPTDAEINSVPAEESIVEVITSDDLQIELSNNVPEYLSLPLAEPLEQKVEIAPKKKLNVLNLGGDLRSASKGHYTLQLSSASQAESLLSLAKKQKLANYLVYETQRHGRRWYVLVYGEYTGMKQAKQALQQLPSRLKKDSPWVRSLADVQTEL